MSPSILICSPIVNLDNGTIDYERGISSLGVDPGPKVSLPRGDYYYDEAKCRFQEALSLANTAFKAHATAYVGVKEEYPLLKEIILGFLSGPIGCTQEVIACGPLLEGSCDTTYVPVETAEDTDIPNNCKDDPNYTLIGMTRELLDEISIENPCLLDQLKGVQYDCSWAALASYDWIARLITVNPCNVKPDVDDSTYHKFLMMNRISHEIGHHLFHIVLPDLCPEMIDEIESIYDASGPGDFLNSEAAKNADEYMAVSTAYFIANPGKLRELRDKRIAETGDKNTPVARMYNFLQTLFRTEFHRPWDIYNENE